MLRTFVYAPKWEKQEKQEVYQTMLHSAMLKGLVLRVLKTVSSTKCQNNYIYDFAMIWTYVFLMIWIWRFFLAYDFLMIFHVFLG